MHLTTLFISTNGKTEPITPIFTPGHVKLIQKRSEICYNWTDTGGFTAHPLESEIMKLGRRKTEEMREN